jgi:arsenate reductase
VHHKTIQVMREKDIDLSSHSPKMVDQFINDSFDCVITVCDHAKETCPVFHGTVKHRLHIGFDDPAEAQGTEEQILGEFRRVRDEIERRFREFYSNEIKQHS